MTTETIFLTDEQLKTMTLSDLEDHDDALVIELESLPRSSDRWRALSAQIKRVEDRIFQITG
jgi:hypothetical protein